MNTDDIDAARKYGNEWVQELGSENASEFPAYQLLKIMRPEVEKVLVVAGFCSPPSQSYRALACLDHLKAARERMYAGIKEGDQVPVKAKIALSQAARLLEDFLSVHRTVWILEGRPL